MAKIRIEDIGDKILVTIGSESSDFYNKDEVVFTVKGYVVTMTYANAVIFSEETKNFVYPKETSPRDLIKKLNSIISSVPAQELTLNELQAIQFANSPSSGNPFATMADTGSQGLENRIIVTQSNFATTIGGVIDSTKDYFIDGIIDLGATQITVPATGITITGYSFDLSALISSEDNYTMFVSESIAIGSGNMLGFDYYVSVTGTNSKVYELYDATGFNAFEFNRINYINCTSLGDIYDYRQGLESGTGRFGSSPSLTLHGLWVGGYRISTSIVRSMSDTTTEPLFKAGTLFQMNSRFLTDINCDLGTLQPFCDFSPTDFPNEGTIQFKGVLMTRDGVSDSNDANITPNLSPSGVCCDWDNNIGMGNTFIGGTLSVTSQAVSTITTAGISVDMAGTWTASDLQHFDSPASNELRHIGTDPKDFRVTFDFVIEGGSGDVVSVDMVKIDTLANVTVEYTQTRVINNLQGARDVAYFNGTFNVRLNQNDLLIWQVANTTDTSDVTVEDSSQWIVEER